MKKIENSPFDPFVKWFFPKLLPSIPRWLSANMVTTIGIVLALLTGLSMGLSALFDVTTAPTIYALGALFLFATWVTDTMDGIIARKRSQVSQLGHYLDHFGDSLTIAFICIGMFISNGSHLVIGLLCATIYLLYHVEAHIKVVLLGELKLPFFGPTEIRFVTILAILAQSTIDFGHPLSWFPRITGTNGWLTKTLGFQSGMTLVDICGILIIIGGSIGLFVQTILTIRRIKQQEENKKPK